MINSEKQNFEKKLAAEKAVGYIKDEMTVGLGSGSTVYFAIKKIGDMVRDGLRIKAVSTSSSTSNLAGSEGIKLISLDEADEIDLTIDGADEVERSSLNGIKGGGGALLFEKIVALSSRRNIWIVDSGKVVDRLGKFPLPVEVVPFGYNRVFKILEERKLNPVIRKTGNKYYLTDSGNYIFDLHTEAIHDVKSLNDEIRLINGVVETGLFIGIADEVIAAKEGSVEILKNERSRL